jgi:hypothetical protein
MIACKARIVFVASSIVKVGVALIGQARKRRAALAVLNNSQIDMTVAGHVADSLGRRIGDLAPSQPQNPAKREEEFWLEQPTPNWATPIRWLRDGNGDQRFYT